MIIGGNGFIGRNLIDSLIKEYPESKVYSLDRGDNIYNHSNYIKSNLHDFNYLNKKLKTIKFDVVIYLASDTTYTNNIEYFDIMYEANVKVLKDTLQFLQENQKIKKFIYFSTCEIYGDSVQPSTESDNVNPVTLYSLTKSMAENIVKYYMNVFELPATIIRPALTYGHGQSDRFFITQAINTLLKGKKLNMTKGEQARDFIHINDLLDAIIKIIKTDSFVKDIVNISSSCEIKLHDLVLLIKTALNSNSEINFGSLDYRSNEIMNFKMSNEKITKEIEWHPKISIEAGIKDLISNLSR